VLRGEAVVDGDDPAGCPGGERPAHHVVRLEVADDPAAAVEEHEAAERLGVRRVDPDRHLAVGTRQAPVLDARDVVERPDVERRRRDVVRARLLDGQ
jgi:hypothetical protein